MSGEEGRSNAMVSNEPIYAPSRASALAHLPISHAEILPTHKPALAKRRGSGQKIRRNEVLHPSQTQEKSTHLIADLGANTRSHR